MVYYVWRIKYGVLRMVYYVWRITYNNSILNNMHMPLTSKWNMSILFYDLLSFRSIGSVLFKIHVCLSLALLFFPIHGSIPGISK